MRLRERSWRVVSWMGAELGRLLDAGCSRGDATAVYARRATVACGIDVDPDDVAAARVAHPEIDFRVAPCEAIPFADGSFDTVICTDVLEHVDDEIRALAELRRVLAGGGTLILTVPHAGSFDWMDPVNYPRRLAPWLWRRAPRVYGWAEARTDDLGPAGRPGRLRRPSIVTTGWTVSSRCSGPPAGMSTRRHRAAPSVAAGSSTPCGRTSPISPASRCETCRRSAGRCSRPVPGSEISTIAFRGAPAAFNVAILLRRG